MIVTRTHAIFNVGGHFVTVQKETDGMLDRGITTKHSSVCSVIYSLSRSVVIKYFGEAGLRRLAPLRPGTTDDSVRPLLRH